MDSDGDGVLTAKDFQLIAENLIKAGNLTGASADRIRDLQSEVWTKYFQQGTGVAEANFEEFIASSKSEGKAALKAIAVEELNLIFDVIDTNQDGRIQLNEFITSFHIYGINEEIAKQAFSGLDINKDGELSRDEFVSAGVDYFLLEEPSYPADLFLGPLE